MKKKTVKPIIDVGKRIVTDLTDEPIIRTVAEMHAAIEQEIAATKDGSLPANEAGKVASQRRNQIGLMNTALGYMRLRVGSAGTASAFRTMLGKAK